MYFWDIESLKHDLVNGNLNQISDLKYLVATIGVLALGCLPYEATNSLDYYYVFINIALFVMGTVFCFHANGGETGAEFLRKYLSISWLITIKFVAVLFPAGVLFVYVMNDFGIIVSSETTLIEVFLCTLISLFYYWRIGHHLKSLNRKGVFINQNYKPMDTSLIARWNIY